MPLIIIICLLINGCYVIKQGYFQLKLLNDAIPIHQALRNQHLTFQQREKLKLVNQVRQFANEKIHLITYNNYKNINLKWSYNLVNVSAADKLAFKAYEWWFPIIGHVPYKGFFDVKDALNQAKILKEQGLDVLISPVAAYSSLGFFNDPLWPSMLQMSDYDLVDLLFHEYTHATIYFKNDALFNESLASFVGKKATKIFYQHYYTKEIYEDLLKNYEQEKLKQLFFHQLYQELDLVYNSQLSNAEKEKNKNTLKEKYQKDYQVKFPHNNLNWDRVNNAFLLSFKRYDNNLSIFADLLDILKGDWKNFFYEISNIDDKDAFNALEKRVNMLKLTKQS